MRKALVVLVVIFLPSILLAADKPPSDTRLLQPVTIESSGKRLHTVVDEIAAMTGVTIRCGDNSKDWQVRDIPVAVCTHDLPLGILLQSLADCTHLRLSKESSSYRIWRDSEGQRLIDEYARQSAAYTRAMAGWDWDVVAEFKDIPTSAVSSLPSGWINNEMDVLALSALLQALGTKVRDKVLSGEVVRLTPATCEEPVRSALLAYLQSYLVAEAKEYHALGVEPPKRHTDDQHITVSLKLNRQRIEVGFTAINTYCQVVTGDSIARWIKDYDFPVQPVPPEAPALAREGIVPLSKIDWRHEPRLAGNLDLSPMRGKEYLSSTELLLALAKDRGLSAVCEDFSSHKVVNSVGYGLQGGSGPCNFPIFSLLKSFDYDFAVYWDSGNGLLEGSSRSLERYVALVAESFLDDIIAKLRTHGIGLDELVSMAQLSYDQHEQWFDYSREIRLLEPVGTLQVEWRAPALRWYGALGAQQKALLSANQAIPISRRDLESFTWDDRLDVELHSALKGSTDASVRFERKSTDSGKTYWYQLDFDYPGMHWIYRLTNDLPIYSKARAEELLKRQKSLTPAPPSPAQ